METIRKPMQGVWNIVRFNWHFYVLAVLFVGFVQFLMPFLSKTLHFYAILFIVGIVTTTSLTLLVSFYVYDLSDLYQLNWLKNTDKKHKILNIHAGFDETSVLLATKFENSELTVLDFYDPIKHTEISIKRARKAYPPYPNTLVVNTSHLPQNDNSVDTIFLIFAAHEIRDTAERIAFFKELSRILKPDGQIMVTEHLRDTANFIAYNIGFFHFLALKEWYKTFEKANLTLISEHKITPFITNFTLNINGITP